MSMIHSAEEEMRPWETKLSSRYLSRGLLYVLVDLPRLMWEPKRSHKQACEHSGRSCRMAAVQSQCLLGRGESGVGTYPEAMPAGSVLGRGVKKGYDEWVNKHPP